jgi:hypothetical protein
VIVGVVCVEVLCVEVVVGCSECNDVLLSENGEQALLDEDDQ